MRRDIQGLRALAVVGVILDHLCHWPDGGFVGVDVFFVISGYLITGLLLREYEKTGTISFLGFYRRRVRRIIPAATLVLAVTTGVAHLLYLGDRFTQIATDGLWAFAFSANWRFAMVGTDYFQATSAISPFQHFWSLSVEEQFYFVWPWLMLGILWVAGRHARWRAEHARVAAATAMTLVIAVSLAWGFHETSSNATQAYFSTFTRTWELGAGALLAAVAPRLATWPERWLRLLSWTGLATITAAMASTPTAPGFPVPWAVPAVVGAALVIIGGAAGAVPHLPLSTRPAGWLGDLSYSLYLWHFPVIVLLGSMFAAPTPAFYLAAVGLTLAGATASYYLVEDPIRKSAWLSGAPRPAGGGRRRRLRSSAPEFRSNLAWAAGLAVAVLLVNVVLLYSGSGVPLEKSAAAASAPTSAAQVSSSAELRAQLTAAIKASDWPSQLTPSLDSLGAPQFAADDADGCAPVGSAAAARGKNCSAITVADPSKTVVVVGDSVAVAWLPTIRAAFGHGGWEVVALTMVGCPYLDAVSENSDPRVQAACPRHKAAVVDTIERLRPALVIASSTYRITFQDRSSPPEVIRQTALREIAGRTRDAGGQFVALAAPPVTANPQECITRVGGPADCLSVQPPYWRTQAAAERTAMAAVGGSFVPTSQWFCVDGRCPAFAGNVRMKDDEVHITEQYARMLAPVLSAALSEGGVTVG